MILMMNCDLYSPLKWHRIYISWHISLCEGGGRGECHGRVRNLAGEPREPSSNPVSRRPNHPLNLGLSRVHRRLTILQGTDSLF